MILEGIVTTNSAESPAAHLAPMGATVNDSEEDHLDHFQLRPFQSSSTFVHLQRDRAGVFHVTDDVLLMSRAVTGRWSAPPATKTIEHFPVPRLADPCRWYAFRVAKCETNEPRATMHCEVVHWGRHRDFVGFHRARHAVLELAILVTRVHLLSHDDVLSAVKPLQTIIDKTAGPSERQAFRLLLDYVEGYYGPLGHHDARGCPTDASSREVPPDLTCFRGATRKSS